MKTTKNIKIALLGLLLLNGCAFLEEKLKAELTFSLGLADGDDNSTTPLSPTSFDFLGSSTNSQNLPAVVDLSPYMPPIGDQGSSYHTCVAWAAGYTARSIANAKRKNLTTSQVASPSNHFSPIDLFTAIPNNVKGADCQRGTQISTALDMMRTRGIATMQTAPYSNISRGCGQENMQSAWENEARQYKITNSRSVAHNVAAIKKALFNGSAVIFGSTLPDGFGDAGNKILRSGTPNSRGSGHAMAVVGYDDGKNAFKIANSWGTQRGDRGFWWVDYNYFVSGFAREKSLFTIVDGDNNQTNPNPPTPTPVPNTTAPDLVPWIYKDVPLDNPYTPNRRIDYNIFNIGNRPVIPPRSCLFVFLYFNAYNLQDYGLIFANGLSAIAPVNSFVALPPYGISHINRVIPANGSLSATQNATYIYTEYSMPAITGDYYLMLYVDLENTVEEANESNNLFVTTPFPKRFVRGYSGRAEYGMADNGNDFSFKNSLTVTPELLAKNEFQTFVRPENPNAYTPQEVMDFLKKEKENGGLAKKIAALKSQATPPQFVK